MTDPTDSSWLNEFPPDDVRAVWDGRLQPIADRDIPSSASAATRQFLIDVGLPADPELPDMIFVHDDRLGRTVRYARRELILITDDESPIALVIDSASDQVYEFDARASRPERLFNSNIAALVFFVGVLQKDVFSRESWTEEELVSAVEQIWRDLAERDPEALEGETPWSAWLNDLVAI